MGILDKLFGKGRGQKGEEIGSTPDKTDRLRENLEQAIRVYLKAARLLATCGHFNEEKFDQVENILSESAHGSMDSTKRAQLKRAVYLLSPEHGVNPWDQVKVMEHQTLAEAVNVFIEMLWKARQDEQTKKFIIWARDEMVEITSLIESGKLKSTNIEETMSSTRELKIETIEKLAKKIKVERICGEYGDVKEIKISIEGKQIKVFFRFDQKYNDEFFKKGTEEEIIYIRRESSDTIPAEVFVSDALVQNLAKEYDLDSKTIYQIVLGKIIRINGYLYYHSGEKDLVPNRIQPDPLKYSLPFKIAQRVNLCEENEKLDKDDDLYDVLYRGPLCKLEEMKDFT